MKIQFNLFLFKKEFERNELKSFDNEIENVYKRLEKFEKHETTRTSTRTSSLRHNLDGIKSQSNELRNESNTYAQK